MKYAGFWRRLAAYILDTLPIVIITAATFYFFLGFDVTLNTYLENNSVENRVNFLQERNMIRDLSFLIWLLYSMVFEASPLQGTVGKFICNIKVIDQNGHRLTYLRSFGRNIAKILSYLVLCIGFLWAAFSKKKLTWHDKIAKTYVILR